MEDDWMDFAPEPVILGTVRAVIVGEVERPDLDWDWWSN